MGSIVLCSASGAPGVTVTALGLALVWPSDVMLLDVDRTPSQAVLAGYLRGEAVRSGGLTGMLRAHRERRPLPEALLDESMLLPAPRERDAGADRRPIQRRFLPGFEHLGAIELFGPVWRDLAGALKESSFDAVLDAGRIGNRGLPPELLESAERVGVVCRSSLVSLAALRLYLAPLLDQVSSERVGLIIVGPARPYRAKEVSEQFGLDVLAEIGWDPRGAGELADGLGVSPRWRRHSLAGSYARAARSLLARREAERVRIGVPT